MHVIQHQDTELKADLSEEMGFHVVQITTHGISRACAKVQLTHRLLFSKLHATGAYDYYTLFS